MVNYKVYIKGETYSYDGPWFFGDIDSARNWGQSHRDEGGRLGREYLIIRTGKNGDEVVEHEEVNQGRHYRKNSSKGGERGR